MNKTNDDSHPQDLEILGPTEWHKAHIGVGPWAVENPNIPLPTSAHYDLELLNVGDTRNVVDHYRYWTREAIIADLDVRRHRFEVVIENFSHDSNIGTIVRTANAFLANKVHIIGKRRWNRRGAMVTDRYQHIEHYSDIASLVRYATAAGLTLIAVDNISGSQRLEQIVLPYDALFIFGHEGLGLTPEALSAAKLHISIAQFGSTRSINAGVAAGIVMHRWISDHVDLNAAW